MVRLLFKGAGVVAICSAMAFGQASNPKAVPTHTQERQRPSVEALQAKGVTHCVAAISNMTNFMYEKEDFAYLNFWDPENTDKHGSLTMMAKQYEDGTSVATLTATPTVDSTCDVTFVQMFVVKQSCAKVRDTMFKDWKYYADLGSTPMYEDPTSSSAVVALASVQESCLIVKSGILFFPLDKQK